MDLHERIMKFKNCLDDPKAFLELDIHQLKRMIRKLENMPMTLELLISTGIGKTVNGKLRKHEELGDRVKSLVINWKDLAKKAVAEEDEAQSEDEKAVSSTTSFSTSKYNKKDHKSQHSVKTPKNHEQSNMMDSNHSTIRSNENHRGNTNNHKSDHISKSSQESALSRKSICKDEENDVYKRRSKNSVRNSIPTDHMAVSNPYSTMKSGQTDETNNKKTLSDTDRGKVAKDKTDSHKKQKEDSLSSNIKKDRDNSKASGAKRKAEASIKEEESKKSRRDSNDYKPLGFTADSGFSFDSILNMGDSASKNNKQKKVKRQKLPHETDPGPTPLDPLNPLGDWDEFSSPDQELVPETSTSGKLDWSKVLPKINTDYCPLPARSSLIDDPKKNASGTVDPSLFSSKKKRTQLYSGRRTHTWTSIPTLYDIAMRVICDNIDAIEDTGDIPFDILRTPLERATAAQLFYIEEKNQYLIEDSDSLWEAHCKKDFRGATPTGDELWRDLYRRKLAEREDKLKKLTKNIAASNKAREAPKKVTQQMTEAKAPREVRRKQMKYGFAGSYSSKTLPTSRDIAEAKRNIDTFSSSSSSSSSGVPPASASVARQSAIFRTGAPIAEERKFERRKPTVAPNMAKALKLMKQRRR